MTEVIFNLSSISNGLEFSSVNYTKNRRFLKIYTILGETSSNWTNDVLETNMCKPFESC